MIALDLDNCIICYDLPFRAAAAQLGCLPGQDAALSKDVIKASAFSIGGNRLWTRLQGRVYGEGIRDAAVFPGCREFVHRAKDRGEEVVIISHKTRFPAEGPKFDLREAASRFLEENDFPQVPVHYCDSREEKVSRLASLNCRALVDDLPEVFQEPAFPRDTVFLLFDPSEVHGSWTATPRTTSWEAAASFLIAS